MSVEENAEGQIPGKLPISIKGEENAGGRIPGKLPISIEGSNTYYGQRQLVDRVIKQWLTANKTKLESKSGAFGTVYKVTNTLLSPNIKIDNKQYYVKQLIIDETRNFQGVEDILNEITMSNELTELVPDSVSNLKGARLSTVEKKAYLIYEGSEGIIMADAIEIIKGSGKSDGERFKDYCYLICSAKRAIDSVNEQKYVHYDMHNNNIFVTYDPKEGWSTAHCKLIDFGQTTKVNNIDLHNGYTSDIIYMMFSIILDSLFRNFQDKLPETNTFLEYMKQYIKTYNNTTDDAIFPIGTHNIHMYCIAIFNLCGKLIRLRDIPGQIARFEAKLLNITKGNGKITDKSNINKKIATLRKEFIDYDSIFNTQIINPGHTANNLFTPNNFAPLPEGSLPPSPQGSLSSQESLPSSVMKAVAAWPPQKPPQGGKKVTRSRKNKKRKTRRV